MPLQLLIFPAEELPGGAFVLYLQWHLQLGGEGYLTSRWFCLTDEGAAPTLQVDNMETTKAIIVWLYSFNDKNTPNPKALGSANECALYHSL